MKNDESGTENPEQEAENLWYVYFGAQVQKARQDKGWQQEDLADLLGLTRPSVTNIEGGRQRVNVRMACEIAMLLGMNIGDVLEGIDIKPTQTQKQMLALFKKRGPARLRRKNNGAVVKVDREVIRRRRIKKLLNTNATT